MYNIGKKSPQKQELQTMQGVSDFRPRTNNLSTFKLKRQNKNIKTKN